MVLLSFDAEEFDIPCDYGVNYNPLLEGISVSNFGIRQILEILKLENVKATFFCTTNFAERSSELVAEIIKDGHEIASHGCDHRVVNLQDIGHSKHILEAITGSTIDGYRQPRMAKIDESELIRNGYSYNASLNPTFIPGRYNNYLASQTPFVNNGLVHVPASVSPLLRIPLFWLSFHNLPYRFYFYLCKRALKKNKVLSLYFHPWEFFPLDKYPELKIPFYIKNQSGDKMKFRLHRLLQDLKRCNEEFETYKFYSNLVK